MALERVPADIRKDGGVARMSDPKVLNIIYFFTILVSRNIISKLDGLFQTVKCIDLKYLDDQKKNGSRNHPCLCKSKNRTFC